MALNSPRANSGLIMLAASIAPSVAPAPTSVWISSMKSIIAPALSFTSFTTLFNRSSKSPRYFAPAIKAPISRAKMILFFKFSGTSPFTIRWAMPSAIAVFPTPGSPTNKGLFLVLRERMCITRLISSSRPITGSSLPEAARWLRFMAYFSNALYFASAFWSLTLLPLRNSKMAARSFFSSTLAALSNLAVSSPTSSIASNKISILT